jgi:hypothetical protein
MDSIDQTVTEIFFTSITLAVWTTWISTTTHTWADCEVDDQTRWGQHWVQGGLTEGEPRPKQVISSSHITLPIYFEYKSVYFDLPTGCKDTISHGSTGISVMSFLSAFESWFGLGQLHELEMEKETDYLVLHQQSQPFCILVWQSHCNQKHCNHCCSPMW